MSEDPVIYKTLPTKRPKHIDVAFDYLRGLKYREIEKKHNITRGGIQYALEKMGVKPNRIRSSARLPKYYREEN